STALNGEVNGDQAQMFGRRFAGLAAILSGMPQPEARLLSVGFAVRTAGILAGPAPRAVRVRACIDYFYSQAAVIHHAGAADVKTVHERLNAATWTKHDLGVSHARVSGPTPQGPIAVNLLVSTAKLRALDCRDHGSDLVSASRTHDAVAATSGGFFLYSEADIEAPCHRTDPVGALISDGQIVAVPSFRRACLVQRAGRPAGIEILGPAGMVIGWTGGSEAVQAVNAHGPGTRAFNRAFGQTSPDDGRPAIAVVGRVVVACGNGPMDIPLNGLVIHLDVRPVGPVTFEMPKPGGTIVEAMGGGPILLSDYLPVRDLVAEDFAGTAPPVTFSQDETFDQNLLPRMVVGSRPDGALVFAAIEGRSFEESPGFTLRQSADLLAAAGCTMAMNLDGGSSKRMVVGHSVVDRPSTELRVDSKAPTAVRPVHTAVLLLR
ncbi:MAG: hypothetical protein ACI9OJ_000216, partial [Myxococcota bacterium]